MDCNSILGQIGMSVPYKYPGKPCKTFHVIIVLIIDVTRLLHEYVKLKTKEMVAVYI